jgi:CBS domain-containing protein
MLLSDVLRTKGHEVITIRTDQTMREAVELLARHRIGAVVVEDHLKPVGIFSERDLVREVMTTPLLTNQLDDTIEHALALMVERRIRHLPVLKNGELVGLVSIGDLIKYRLDQKELEANVLLDIARMRA